MSTLRQRHPELEGRYAIRGQYQMTVSSGAVTTIAARTATAGHLFSFRWGDTTGFHAYVRSVTARFILTTAYGTAQETGCDLIMARSYTASHTGGTAIDVGGTVTNTGKLLTHQPTSLLTSARVASTAELTAGTQTLDANALATLSDWSAAIGATVPLAASGSGSRPGVLYDGLGDKAPLVLAQDEGFVIRNLILMGATGVGRWEFTVAWDEGKPY